MRALLLGLLGDPAHLVLLMQAGTTAALLVALTLRVLADKLPSLAPYRRPLTLIVEPLLLAFGIVLFMRLSA